MLGKSQCTYNIHYVACTAEMSCVCGDRSEKWPPDIYCHSIAICPLVRGGRKGLVQHRALGSG